MPLTENITFMSQCDFLNHWVKVIIIKSSIYVFIEWKGEGEWQDPSPPCRFFLRKRATMSIPLLSVTLSRLIVGVFYRQTFKSLHFMFNIPWGPHLKTHSSPTSTILYGLEWLHCLDLVAVACVQSPREWAGWGIMQRHQRVRWSTCSCDGVPQLVKWQRSCLWNIRTEENVLVDKKRTCVKQVVVFFYCFLYFTLYVRIFFHRRKNSCWFSFPVTDV